MLVTLMDRQPDIIVSMTIIWSTGSTGWTNLKDVIGYEADHKMT